MTPGLWIVAAIDAAVLAVPLVTTVPGGAALLSLHVMLIVAGYWLWLREGGRIDFAAAMLGVMSPVALLLVRQAAAVRPARRRAAMPLPEPAARAQAGQRGAQLAVARMLDGRVLHATPDTLHSLVTVMRHGRVAERRRALETVVRSFQPALSPLIALALTDRDQTIRALAAAASARVVENLAVGRAALAALPDDAEAQATLAALLADHARANVLLSDSQRGHLRDDALALHGGASDDTLRIEALWAAGDYAAIDALLAARPVDGGIAAWWRDGAAA